MSMTICELMVKKGALKDVPDLDKISIEDKEEAGFEALKMLLNGEVKVETWPNFNELLTTTDYTSLFKRVVTDMALKPVEPLMIGQSIIATTVEAGNATEVRIPAFGALQAEEIGEGREYPEVSLGFAENAVSVQIKKYGLRVSVSDELVKKSLWPIIGMHVDAGLAALKRKKEQTIFDGMTNAAHSVFDNNLGFTGGTPPTVSDSTLITTGRDINGAYNATITMLDLVDLIAAPLVNGYAPTDLIMHPLSWVILAKDPTLRNFAWYTGNVTNAPWTKIGPNEQQANMPFGLQLNISPFVTFNRASSPYKTHIYCVSRNNAVILLQGDGPETEEWRDPRIDAQHLKIREYWGAALPDFGRAVAVAKNVHIAESFGPIQLYKQLT